MLNLRPLVVTRSPAARRRLVKYLDSFESRIAGIPCLIGVTSLKSVPGNSGADNPDDYYGYTEFEYDVLDRAGSPAPWLADKATPEDLREIESVAWRRADYDDDYDGSGLDYD